MRRAALLPTVLLLGACSSQPTTDRAVLPERPEVHRPDGVEPDGLLEMRSALAAQRAEARERDNALNMRAAPMSETGQPWYEQAWEFFDGFAKFIGF
jgi:hypothetical protein